MWQLVVIVPVFWLIVVIFVFCLCPSVLDASSRLKVGISISIRRHFNKKSNLVHKLDWIKHYIFYSIYAWLKGYGGGWPDIGESQTLANQTPPCYSSSITSASHWRAHRHTLTHAPRFCVILSSRARPGIGAARDVHSSCATILAYYVITYSRIRGTAVSRVTQF